MGKGEQTCITRQGSMQAVETNLEVIQAESCYDSLLVTD